MEMHLCPSCERTCGISKMSRNELVPISLLLLLLLCSLILYFIASRAGHVDVIKFLVDHGADINAISNFGHGFSPLRLAKIHLKDPDHPIFTYFHSMGAIERYPDFDGPEALRERVTWHLAHGHNQYAPLGR